MPEYNVVTYLFFLAKIDPYPDYKFCFIIISKIADIKIFIVNVLLEYIIYLVSIGPGGYCMFYWSTIYVVIHCI